MSDGRTQRPPPVDAELLERLKESVEERHGRLYGHYRSELESAIEEWLNASEGGDTHDRLTRIENDLSEIKDAVMDREPKKKKEIPSGSVTEKRLNKITTAIASETANAAKVPATIVEQAIREHAGGSGPTVRRYKRLLKQDQELFDHPTKDTVYFRDATDFVLAVNAARKGGKIRQEQYDAFVDPYGEEWWIEQQPGTDERGFE